jgi:hypothetical protein
MVRHFLSLLLVGLAGATSSLGPFPCLVQEDAAVGISVCSSLASDMNLGIMSLPDFQGPADIMSASLAPSYLGSPVPFLLQGYDVLVLSAPLDRESFGSFVLELSILVAGPFWQTNATVTVAVTVANVMEPPSWVYSSPLSLDLSMASASVEVCTRRPIAVPPSF